MGEEKPLVSILIPNYNKSPYLRETLDSVLAQTYSNWECIIVDDHSTDNSWEILELYAGKDSRFKIFKRPSHLQKGGNVCRNYALSQSSGDLIFFLDSDDVLSPDCLHQRISKIQEYPNLDFWAFPTALFENEVSDAKFLWNTDNSDESDLGRFLRLDVLWQTSGCIYNREFLLSVNGLSPNQKFWQDYELHLKVLLSTTSYQKFFHFPPDVYIRNGDKSSLSRSTPFTADLEILLKRIQFLEEISSFACMKRRVFTKDETHSLFSFQFYLILQLWLKHGKFLSFTRKWKLYAREYGLTTMNQVRGLLLSISLKINNRVKFLGKGLKPKSRNFPDYFILEGCMIGRHEIL